MKGTSTAQLRRWVLVGLGMGALVSLLAGILLTGDWGGLLLNVGAEFGGALATYVLLELVIGRREEHEERKVALIAQLGSRANDMAVAAAEELRRHGWLTDGSLRGAYLFQANLQGAYLIWADLQGTNLTNANLRGANLQGADLKDTILTDADLREANLAWADLSRANLLNADLVKADLLGATLFGAKLDYAKLEGAHLSGARLDRDTRLPDGTDWTPNARMARFTDCKRPDFWSPTGT